MKKYYRSTTNRSIAGVIGGLIEYMSWDVDPNLVRLLYALLTVFTGGGLLLVYVLAWIIVPSKTEICG